MHSKYFKVLAVNFHEVFIYMTRIIRLLTLFTCRKNGAIFISDQVTPCLSGQWIPKLSSELSIYSRHRKAPKLKYVIKRYPLATTLGALGIEASLRQGGQQRGSIQYQIIFVF